MFVETIAAAEAYDRWFRRGWGKYAFDIEAKALLRGGGELAGMRALDAGSGVDGSATGSSVLRIGDWPTGFVSTAVMERETSDYRVRCLNGPAPLKRRCLRR